MPFPPNVCYFCGEDPTGEYVVLVGPGPKPTDAWTLLYLCAVHHGILAAAGAHGRRYRNYPDRYWLGDESKQRGF